MESTVGGQRLISDPDQADAPLAILMQEKSRLENAVAHLKDSNVQLEEALRDSGPDEEYTTAISENKVVIMELEQKIRQLEEDIRLAKELSENEMETGGNGNGMVETQNNFSNGSWL